MKNKRIEKEHKFMRDNNKKNYCFSKLISWDKHKLHKNFIYSFLNKMQFATFRKQMLYTIFYFTS